MKAPQEPVFGNAPNQLKNKNLSLCGMRTKNAAQRKDKFDDRAVPGICLIIV